MVELLIAMSIMGVVVTFTIPKVIQSQQDTRFNAVAKEAASSVSAAYAQYRTYNQPTTGFNIQNLTPYLNYVRVMTSGNIDATYTHNTFSCNSGCPCYLFHNGAVLRACPEGLGNTTTTAATPFHIDPDGIVTDGTTNGPGKTVGFFLFINGRISDEGHLSPAAYTGSATYISDPSSVPPWFNWN